MLQTGKEEKLLAIKNGDVTTTGIPYITVIVDGGWSHRSFGHRYTSSSGVACVIGWRTKKLLYVGVRNKYCYTCDTENVIICLLSTKCVLKIGMELLLVWNLI